MIILQIIFVILLLIGLLILILLFWPIELRCRISFDYLKITLRVRAKIINGLIVIHLRDFDNLRIQSGPLSVSVPLEKRENTNTNDETGSIIGKMEKMKEAFSKVGLLKQHREEITDFLSRLQLSELKIHLAYGFLNPAATGMLYGIILPLVHLLPSKACEVTQSPDFTGTHFEGRMFCRMRFQILSLLWPAKKLLFHMRRDFRKLT